MDYHVYQSMLWAKSTSLVPWVQGFFGVRRDNGGMRGRKAVNMGGANLVCPHYPYERKRTFGTLGKINWTI